MQSPSQPDRVRVLRARWVFPIAGRPIPGGVVTIRGERIASVESGPADGPCQDLGNVAILPGWVNAHTHLEFSDLVGPLGEPGMGLVDWIGRLVEFRRQVADTPRRPVEQGIEESIRSGTTCLGEIAQPPMRWEPWEACPLEATVFGELIGPTADRFDEAIAAAKDHLASALTIRTGLSPHAPYSVHIDLLEKLILLSAAERVPLAFHLAESAEELELIRGRGGPFRELLERLGAWNPEGLAPSGKTADYLQRLASAHRALVIHGNYLDDEEIAFLAARTDRMAVVYCPRTHAFIGHDAYPLEKMLTAGVTLALGTDSRASSPDLDLLGEMRFLAGQRGGPPPETILRLGTLGGASALGMEHAVGSLEAGKYADLAVVSLPDRPADDPHELLFAPEARVVSTWFHGTRTGEPEV
jgi:cytosine/adenosine deaminase-related metal-dependent hydrolase